MGVSSYSATNRLLTVGSSTELLYSSPRFPRVLVDIPIYELLTHLCCRARTRSLSLQVRRR